MTEQPGMSPEEEETRALMVAYSALKFAAQPKVHAAWTRYNEVVVGSVFDGPVWTPSPGHAELAAEIIYRMIIQRTVGDEALTRAISHLRPDQQDRVRRGLAEDREIYGGG